MENISSLKRKCVPALASEIIKKPRVDGSTNSVDIADTWEDDQGQGNNLALFNAARRNLKIQQRQDVTVCKPQLSLNFIFELPKMVGKNWFVKSLTAEGHDWKISIL